MFFKIEKIAHKEKIYYSKLFKFPNGDEYDEEMVVGFCYFLALIVSGM